MFSLKELYKTLHLHVETNIIRTKVYYYTLFKYLFTTVHKQVCCLVTSYDAYIAQLKKITISFFKIKLHQ